MELELEFLTPDLVLVQWKPGITPIPYAIAKSEWEPVEVTFEDKGDRWLISSSALKVIIHSDATLEFQDSAGRIVRQERSPQRPIHLHNTIKSKQGEGWEHQAELRPEEQIYGLGERAAPLNLRTPTQKGKPRTYRMWNYDAGGRYGAGTDPLYLGIPVYLGLHSQGSYLIFYENSFPAKFRFQETATAEFEGGALRYYITVGSLPRLLQQYTELTGRSPLPLGQEFNAMPGHGLAILKPVGKVYNKQFQRY